ncbi:MAG: hypothetical protein L3J59_00900 [Methylococcaceae bacterium]|nr:hypothetical protein [Methylococcaceae bacterium]
MLRFLLIITFYLVLSVSLASPLSKEKVPEPLKPWVNWVLQDEENYQCPFFFNDFQNKQCSWPGKLTLNLQAKQATFTSQWYVYKESWVLLPGNLDHWPQNVTINDKPALVITKQGKPSIKLLKGEHSLKGKFFWDHIPENLAIPNKTGLLTLKINGKNIPYPSIKGGRVWLKASDIGDKKQQRLENKLELQVFRKIYDDIPFQVMSYLELEVSGDQREITLPYALLTDFIPISLKSPLPAKLDPNGSLLIQVRPGRWHIELNARHPKPVSELAFNVEDKAWPESEIWSFQASPSQRIVEIKGVTAIDPSQTNIPHQWKQLPVYQVKKNDRIDFKLIRRGDPEPEPNRLNLKRQLWLDFSGEAYTVTDTITGKMTKGWRLNTLQETQLGQVKLNNQSQLITTDSDRQGVEVRKGHIYLQADSRINSSISNISAVGWDQNFHQVQAELNIPPGWHLLAADGVDNVPDSWISKWTLLDLFIVMIIALSISRLWSVYWGIFALITLGLCWHEQGSPQFIWLNILAAIALLRVLPIGKFQTLIVWYRNICWLALLVIVIPFMVSQVRTGLYPQLEKQYTQSYDIGVFNNETDFESDLQVSEMKETAEMSQQPMKKMRDFSRSVVSKVEKTKYKQKIQEKIDPDANIQTGPGLPQWQWKKIQLLWNGSVDQQQKIKFWYLSPALSMLLNFLRVMLVLLLSLLMFNLLNKKFTFPKSLFSYLLLISLISLPSHDVYADFPDQEILDDLKNRLLKAPDCLPDCAQISRMDLSINSQQMVIKLQVHAEQAVAIPLPSQFKQWTPNQVIVNSKVAQALVRTQAGELWLSLDKGLHQVELNGITPVLNKFSLALPLKPQFTKIDAEGWTIEGLRKNNKTDSQLIFSRVKSAQKLKNNKQKFEQGALPAFLKIERELKLGLDWRITTRVTRIFQNDTAVSIKLPLLQGESVITEHIRVKNKQVLINMSSKQRNLQWESVLKKTPQINLIAPDTHQWTEIWRANVSPIWHLEATGIAVVHHQNQGQWLPEWRPWANEKVSLTITRPEAVKGSTLTIDRSEQIIKPGKRSLETELKLSLRSSKGTQHTLILPDKVELQSVSINEIAQPIRQKNGKVTLPIKPGLQDISLSWRKMQEQSVGLKTETINLGIASVNSHIKILLGQDRWVLFTSGPKFGPAVLFWGVLFVMALLSVGLGKVPLTPLKYWHWFLLFIGLSQIPIESALIVIIWLMALGFRIKKPFVDSSYFNLMQIGLGLLTVFSLGLLFAAVEQGLLGSPDMQISGNHSSAFNLNWYQDRTEKTLPTANIISVPLMAYRILMLLWSLWLAVSLLNWLKWGWACFSSQGLWRRKEKK